MNIVIGLSGRPYAYSDDDNKIDLLDSLAEIKKKLKKGFCEPGNIQRNGVLALAKSVIFPAFEYRKNLGHCEKYFVVERSFENGDAVFYESYNDLEKAFATRELHPSDLKSAVALYINSLIEPIRTTFENASLKNVINRAYSDAVVSKKLTGENNYFVKD